MKAKQLGAQGASAREEKSEQKAKSRTSARHAVLKTTGLTLHLRHRARRVSKTFTHSHAQPSETAARNRDALTPGIPALTTTSTHHYDCNCPDETPKTATVTNTNKISRASLRLTHELGGHIRRMRSRAPTEDLKNTSNTKIHQLSLSATPTQARGLLTRARIRSPL
jgi:hypothetical protein